MSTADSPGFFRGSPLYTWTSPGCPIRVRIHLDVIEGIRLQLDAAAFMSGTAGVSGLLTGEMPAFGVTVISGFLPVLPSDSTEIEHALKSARGLVVGFYRTARNRTLNLNDNEISLAKSFFRHQGTVLLSIETGAGADISGRFFFWKHEVLTTDSSPLASFPFSAHLLSKTEWKPSMFPETAGQVRRRSVWLERALWLCSTVIVTSAALVYRFNEQTFANPASGIAANSLASASSASKSTLSLVAERRGADLLVSWNPESPAIPGAVVGTLSIHDSNIAIRNMLLTPEQLSSGHLLYAPVSDQVEIRLSVSDESQSTTSDSITVLLPQSGSARSLLAQQQPVRQDHLKQLAQFPPLGLPAVTSVALPSSTRPVSAATLPARPAETAMDVGTRNQRPTANVLDAIIASLTSVSNQPYLDPASGPVPVPDEGPVLMQTKIPRFPMVVTPNRIDHTAKVQVQVSIDPAGTVVKAVVPQPNANEPLGAVAISMAKTLKFQPAMTRNERVPSEMLVNFDFAPRQ